jgi:hypothetical protein
VHARHLLTALADLFHFLFCVWQKWLEAQLREVEMQQDIMPLRTTSLKADHETSEGSQDTAEDGDEGNSVRRFVLVLKDVTGGFPKLSTSSWRELYGSEPWLLCE